MTTGLFRRSPADSARWRPLAGTARDTAIVLVVAIALRGLCFAVSMQEPQARQLENDSHGYKVLASNLASGEGFGRLLDLDKTGTDSWIPELCRTPGYPAILAALELLTGDGQTAVILLQHLLTLGVCLVVMTVCRRRFGHRAGMVAGVLLALDLQGVALGNLVLTAVPYGFLLVLAALAAARTVARPSLLGGVLLGAILGASALVRPTSLMLPTLIALLLFGHALWRRQARGIKVAIAVALTGNALVGGWIVRNGQVCGEYTLSTIPRCNLLFHHARGAIDRAEEAMTETDGGRTPGDSTLRLAAELGVPRAHVRFLSMSPSENARLKSLAVSSLWTHRSAFFRDWLIRSANTICGPDKQILTVLGLPWINFGVLPSGGVTAPERSVPGLALLAVQLLFLASLYLLVLRAIYQACRRRSHPALFWICLGLAAYVLVLSSGQPGDPRLRWPAIPLLVIAGAACLQPTRPVRMVTP